MALSVNAPSSANAGLANTREEFLRNLESGRVAYALLSSIAAEMLDGNIAEPSGLTKQQPEHQESPAPDYRSLRSTLSRFVSRRHFLS
jgi:hypothetical protein